MASGVYRQSGNVLLRPSEIGLHAHAQETPRPSRLHRYDEAGALRIRECSDRGGKFDIWVRQVSGGDPVQITKGPGHNWQPDWSPDGKYIAYRSENGEGGLFVIPALGGVGMERRIASFGYHPRWSPDSSQILFQTTHFPNLNRIHVVGLDGSAPREIAADFKSRHPETLSAAWHPDGKRVSIWTDEEGPSPSFWTLPIAGGAAVKSEIPAADRKTVWRGADQAGVNGYWIPSSHGRLREARFISSAHFEGPETPGR